MSLFWKRKQPPGETALQMFAAILEKGNKDEVEKLWW
jgi:hypothetical protein